MDLLAVARDAACDHGGARPLTRRRPTCARCATWHASSCSPLHRLARGAVPTARPSRRGPFLCRSRARHLLSPGEGAAPRPTSASRRCRCPPRLLAHLRRWQSPRHRQRAFRRMERAAGQVGEDRVQDRARLAEVSGRICPHTLAPHRGDVADAERRAHVAGGRLRRHERADDPRGLRSPSPRPHAGSGCRLRPPRRRSPAPGAGGLARRGPPQARGGGAQTA